MNWKAVTALIIVLSLIGIGAGYVRDSRVDTDFPAIRARSDEGAVRQLMGTPKEIQRPCRAYDTIVTPDCNHVFIYRSIFYPLRGKYWLVFFNENNRVIATSSQLEP